MRTLCWYVSILIISVGLTTTGFTQSIDRKEIKLHYKRATELLSRAESSSDPKRLVRKAAHEYKTIIYLAPAEKEGYLGLMKCIRDKQRFYSNEEIREATRIVTEFLDIASTKKEKKRALRFLAMAYDLLRDHSNKIAVLEKLADLGPVYGFHAHCDIGATYRFLRDSVNSKRAYRRCAEAILKVPLGNMPRLSKLTMLGNIYAYNLGDHKIALGYFEQALELCDSPLYRNDMKMRIKGVKEKLYGPNIQTREQILLDQAFAKLDEVEQSFKIRNFKPEVLEYASHLSRVINYYHEEGEYTKVVDVFEKFDALCPYRTHFGPIYKNSGIQLHALMKTYGNFGQWKKVWSYYIMSLDPNHNPDQADLGYAPILTELTPLLEQYFSEKREIHIVHNATITSRWIAFLDSTRLQAIKVIRDGLILSDRQTLLIGRSNMSGGQIVYRTFLKFDVSDIPKEFTIDQAILILFGNINKGFAAYRVTRRWNMQDVGKLQFDLTKPAFILPHMNSLSSKQNVAFDVTPLVQHWIQHDGSNHGLLLKDYAEDNKYRSGKGFYSKVKLVLFLQSKHRPIIAEAKVFGFKEDEITLYRQGLKGLAEGNLSKAIVYWEEAYLIAKAKGGTLDPRHPLVRGTLHPLIQRHINLAIRD